MSLNASLWEPCNPCPCACHGRSPFAKAGCVGLRPPTRSCTPPADGRARIPNIAHQIWLGGGVLKWEYLLSMLAIRFVLRPEQYLLHFDLKPEDTPQWACACSLAQCVHASSPQKIYNKPLNRVQHRSDVLRLDLLSRHGGIYLDHDAFVVRHEAMHELRTSCDAPLIAGKQVEQTRSKLAIEARMNNGVMMAAPDAKILQLWKESYRDYKGGSWDFNSCEVPLRLAEAQPSLAHLTPEIAPLPRDPRAHHAHLKTAPVVHITGLLSKWWNGILNRCRVVSTLLETVLREVNASGLPMTDEQAKCAERVRVEMLKRWH